MVVFVCNSTNPDLARYFAVKRDGLESKRVRFLAQRNVAKTLDVPTSCLSPSPRLNVWFCVDCFYSFVVIAKIVLWRVSTIIFDTAHPSNIPLALLCKCLGIRTIFTIHDWQPHPGRAEKGVRFYNAVVRRLANGVIVFSDIKTSLPVVQLSLGGFPCKSSQWRPGEYFLFFGRIEPYKGLGHLIKIAKSMSAASTARILVAGRGDDEALEELVKLPNVEVLNKYLAEEDLNCLIERCIAVLCPYDSATQSGVVIHALSYCKPVIAFDVGAFSEYITNDRTGYIVPHGDIDEFVRCMEVTASMQERFRKDIEIEFGERFSERRFVDQYRTFVNELYSDELPK